MMKRIFSFILTITLLVLSAGVLYAQETDYQRVQVLPENEVVDRDYFVGGSVVEINGTINGDLYAGAGELYVNGTVNGDVLAGAGKIRITGEVNGNVRAGSGEILISGTVTGNSTLAGDTLEIGSQAQMGGNVVMAGSRAIVAAPLTGDLTVAAGSLTLSSSVDGDVEARVGELNVTPSAAIGGNLAYWSDNTEIDEAASISGQVSNNTLPEEFRAPKDETVKAVFSAISLMTTVVSVILTIIIGVLLLRLFPKHLARATGILASNPVRAILIGFATCVVVVVITVVLLISILGIPVVLTLLPLFFFYTYASRIIVMLFLGMKVLQFAQFKDRPYIALLTGIVFYYLLALLPIFGGLIKMILVFAALGTALTNDKNTYLDARKKGII